MGNKNIYIGLGVLATVVAVYLFTKKKGAVVVGSGSPETKPETAGKLTQKQREDIIKSLVNPQSSADGSESVDFKQFDILSDADLLAAKKMMETVKKYPNADLTKYKGSSNNANFDSKMKNGGVIDIADMKKDFANFKNEAELKKELGKMDLTLDEFKQGGYALMLVGLISSKPMLEKFSGKQILIIDSGSKGKPETPKKPIQKPIRKAKPMVKKYLGFDSEGAIEDNFSAAGRGMAYRRPAPSANKSRWRLRGFKGNQGTNHGDGTYGGVGFGISISDVATKENIRISADGMIDKIMQVKTYDYNYNTTEFPSLDSGDKTGVMAQEIKKVFPHLVKNVMIDSKQVLAVDYFGIITCLIKGMQEQQIEIQNLKGGKTNS